jgi:hypothetical protein
LLPGMGWGLPASPGHYLDLVSAVAGGALLLLAGVLWLVRRDGAVDAPQPARVAAPTR